MDFQVLGRIALMPYSSLSDFSWVKKIWVKVSLGGVNNNRVS